MIKDKIPSDIVLRYSIKPGDIDFIVYLHGQLFAEEYGFRDTFETQVRASLDDFSLSLLFAGWQDICSNAFIRLAQCTSALGSQALINIRVFILCPAIICRNFL